MALVGTRGHALTFDAAVVSDVLQSNGARSGVDALTVFGTLTRDARHTRLNTCPYPCPHMSTHMSKHMSRHMSRHMHGSDDSVS